MAGNPFFASLQRENEELRARLEEAEETLRAIRNGEVDALVVSGEHGEQVFTLRGADHPYRVLIESMSEGALTLTAEGLILYANRRVAELVKAPLERVIGSSLEAWVAPEDQGLLRSLLQRGAGERRHTEISLVAADGARVPAGLSLGDLCIEGSPASLCAVLADLREKKLREELIASERLARSILDQANEALIVCDSAGQVFRVSKVAQALCNVDPHGLPFERAFPLRWANGQSFSFSQKDYHRRLYGIEVSLDCAGQTRYFLLNASPLVGDQDEILGRVVTLTDITARKRTEEALRESERRLREAQALGRIGDWEYDLRSRTIRWSDQVYALYERDPALGPPTVEEEAAYYSPEQARILREYARRAIEEGLSFAYDLEAILPSGRTTYFSATMRPIRDEDGKVVKLAGTVQDITERKRAEMEREKLQTQLLQAQKMEAVGRLAGGVAHDFNNMLTVILGHVQLAMMDLEPSNPLRADLEEIRKAAQRSADLTRQLLAFARKQTIAPKVLDLNETITGMLKMLRRLIGEDIDLVWMPGAKLWPVKMDPAQVDQILANLCVNARDAISGVGKVILETRNVTLDEAYCAVHADFRPGQYVMLAVSDNGCGMNEEVLEHLFEPFFTTKGVGQGTGLGLSTVYGIVKQNEGFINVYSEVGRGTTFKIYIPRFAGEVAEDQAERVLEPPRGHGETLLLVEDEVAILDLGKRLLEGLGYRVLTANRPSEALRQAEAYTGEIHLLITDLVMPEMDGRELEKRLKAIKPGLRCLFTSGYTANVISHHGVLDENVRFIQKPFSTYDLAVKVREALEAG